MYARGQHKESTAYNGAWADYMNNNFSAPQYAAQQERFNTKNMRMN